MDFSLWPSAARTWQEVLEGAEYAESTGWYGVWMADHFMVNGDDLSLPMNECFALLAGLAVRTERVRLGSMVLGNTYRHPAVVAKQAATLDQMSGGRFVLGLGAGWQVNEHEAYGIELPPVKELLARFEEACQVFTGLLKQDRTDFAGKYYQLTDAPLEPKPAKLPILIGASGEKVALGIVAKYADEWNHWGLPEVAEHKGNVFREHCERIGRDPSSVRRSTQAIIEIIEPGDTEAEGRRDSRIAAGRPTIMGSADYVLDTVARYPAAGIDEFLVPDGFLGSGSHRFDALERLRTEVFEKV
ncbi:TIGR03560 family F420-dependent LLM class oxidoreductase [Streptomyces sp. SID13031]|uniref:TIGR03560 family F420-dependent LLM class oxidoreductase n=1 Tax=Streptomyces sp. SID13031 TaxID=2706046 RepID=UPI0013CC79BF|nr:TIGR03560 family F420-dependent LLM class oxidoreductase [Streptomyces sp. SID13031]NEA34531.1 TIGR03560 family F420-dependent LLM class oxidoreductase [Streptomyces sp. SID13031]